MSLTFLGIESSCDETAAAVIRDNKILSNVVATQHDVHARFGGVVPELASRRHLENIVPVIRKALTDAKVVLDDISGIAVTNAPGLVGSLLIGISAAKGIAYAKNLTLIGVNHLEGHLNAAELEFGDIPLPYVGLVVSGGHTSLYLVSGFGKYKLLGATRDDAAGEAFDKVAKLLELGYPGGPAIDTASKNGNPKAFRFTKPKFEQDDSLDFSFSGIKTAVLLTHRKEKEKGKVSSSFVSDIAASFQESVVSFLVERLIQAAKIHKAGAVVLAGGVAANKRLREHLQLTANEHGIKCFVPAMSFCTDNAAMIAYVGAKKIAAGERSDMALNAVANQEIGI